MRCEVCGKKIRGKPVKAIIEGAKLTVCSDCSRHGRIVLEEIRETVSSPPVTAKQRQSPPRIVLKTDRSDKTLEGEMELVDDFAQRIRNAREKLGWTHEDLGRKINEKVSLLKKIEAGKMVPDDKLVAKLEHTLRIKLLAPASGFKAPKTEAAKPQTQGLTLGDLIPWDNGEAEEKS